jgi:hypothetical protein
LTDSPLSDMSFHFCGALALPRDHICHHLLPCCPLFPIYNHAYHTRYSSSVKHLSYIDRRDMQFLRNSLKSILEPTPSQESRLSFEVISPDDWKAQYSGTELTRDGIIQAVYGTSPQSLVSDEGKNSHLSALGDGKNSKRVLDLLMGQSVCTFNGETRAPSVYPGSDLHELIVKPTSSLNDSQIHHGDGFQVLGFSVQPETESPPTHVLAIHTGKNSTCACEHEPTMIAGLSDQEYANFWHDILSTDGQTTGGPPDDVQSASPTTSGVNDRQSELVAASDNFPTRGLSVQSGIHDLVKSPIRSPQSTALEIGQTTLGSSSIKSYGTFNV